MLSEVSPHPNDTESKHISIIISKRSHSNTFLKHFLNRKSPFEPKTNTTTVAHSTLGLISPLDRLKNFENEVSKKVDSFKKKLTEIVKSARRNTYNTDLSARPKTTGKVLTTMGDEINKSDPKISMFSPGNVHHNLRTSPMEYNYTPRLENKERTEKGSHPSREWTVGTTVNQRMNTIDCKKH